MEKVSLSIREGKFIKENTPKLFLKFIAEVQHLKPLFEFYEKKLSTQENYLNLLKSFREVLGKKGYEINFYEIADSLANETSLASFVILSSAWLKNIDDISRLIYDLMYKNKKKKQLQIILVLVLIMV